MKKLLSLTSLALLGTIALTGCSCGKNGEYTFSHLEYEEDGKTKKTDCSSTEGLPNQVKVVCALVPDESEVLLVIDGNKITSENGKNSLFFKIEDQKIRVSATEDGNYTDSGMVYKKGAIRLVSRGVTWVYDN